MVCHCLDVYHLTNILFIGPSFGSFQIEVVWNTVVRPSKHSSELTFLFWLKIIQLNFNQWLFRRMFNDPKLLIRKLLSCCSIWWPLCTQGSSCLLIWTRLVAFKLKPQKILVLTFFLIPESKQFQPEPPLPWKFPNFTFRHRTLTLSVSTGKSAICMQSGHCFGSTFSGLRNIKIIFFWDVCAKFEICKIIS